MSAAENTLAVGLLGVLMTIMRVFGVIALLHFLPVDAVVGKLEPHVHRLAAVDLDRGHVAVVGGLEHDHFVAGPDEGGDRGENAVRGAGRDRDFVLGIVVGAVERGNLVGDALAQRHDAGHRRVLVEVRLSCTW